MFKILAIIARMKEASISELKNQLSAFLAQLKTCGSITITDHGSPIAVIYPISREDENGAEKLNRLKKSGLVSQALQKPSPRIGKSIKLSKKADAARVLIDERE